MARVRTSSAPPVVLVVDARTTAARSRSSPRHCARLTRRSRLLPQVLLISQCCCPRRATPRSTPRQLSPPPQPSYGTSALRRLRRAPLRSETPAAESGQRPPPEKSDRSSSRPATQLHGVLKLQLRVTRAVRCQARQHLSPHPHSAQPNRRSGRSSGSHPVCRCTPHKSLPILAAKRVLCAPAARRSRSSRSTSEFL